MDFCTLKSISFLKIICFIISFYSPTTVFFPTPPAAPPLPSPQYSPYPFLPTEGLPWKSTKSAHLDGAESMPSPLH